MIHQQAVEEFERTRRQLMAKGKPKPGGTRDKRLKENRPRTGAGSKGGRVPRRAPRRK